MRAVQFMEYGDASVLRVNEVPTPRPSKGSVLVRVAASSINPHDLVVRSGKLRMVTGWKFPLGTGLDFAGEISAFGEGVEGLALGSRVWGVLPPTGRHKTGTAAEFVVVEAKRVAHTPAELSDVEAASLAVVGTTAYLALTRELSLKRGESLLVRGAAGGVGAAAVQLACAMGAKVTALVSVKDAASVKAMGAETVFDYRKSTPSDLPKFDAILDCVGTALLQYRGILKPKGRMVTVNFGSARAMLAIAVSVLFGTRRIRTFSANPTALELDAVARYVQAGLLRPRVGTIFSLEEIVEAHGSVESGGCGKHVLRVW